MVKSINLVFEGHNIVYAVNVDNTSGFTYMLEMNSDGLYTRKNINTWGIDGPQYLNGGRVIMTLPLTQYDPGFRHALEGFGNYWRKEYSGYHQVAFDRLISISYTNDYFMTREQALASPDWRKETELTFGDFIIKQQEMKLENIISFRKGNLFRDLAIGGLVIFFVLIISRVTQKARTQ